MHMYISTVYQSNDDAIFNFRSPCFWPGPAPFIVRVHVLVHNTANSYAARRGAVLATICEHSTAPRREDRPEF